MSSWSEASGVLDIFQVPLGSTFVAGEVESVAGQSRCLTGWLCPRCHPGQPPLQYLPSPMEPRAEPRARRLPDPLPSPNILPWSEGQRGPVSHCGLDSGSGLKTAGGQR